MQKLTSKIRKACEDYNLISTGDKIAVGVSGGKDSLTLLVCLANLRRYYPQKFDLVAISVDMFNGESNFDDIKALCDKIGVEFYVVPSQINNIVFKTRKETNPCSLCAKLRRGILNNFAKSIGCNKIALGHHKDDLIQTFFLSMFYEGRLSTFMPNIHLSTVGLNVIRPMIYIDEKDIIAVSKKEKLPVMFNCCPANKKTEREHIKQIIDYIKHEIPISKERTFKAIISDDRYNLFDKFRANNMIDPERKSKKAS